MGSDLSDQNIYDEARNRIHARNGEREETTEELSNPLLVYINILALLFVLHAYTMCCVVTVFSLSNIESNKSKCCPALAGAWMPANAGTHAEPLYILL